MSDIRSKLQSLEEEMEIYSSYMDNAANPEADRKIVGFRLFYDMISFSSLLPFEPGYKPKDSTTMTLASGLKGINEYVSIQNGKVVISDEYKSLLQRKDEFEKMIKTKSNGKVD